ncbi:dienelactone hydrolase family protein [Chachezhania sediminis]|uniref:dienelactone hydrolase family protein n=1 Tax=Chachezhania sediminis TaxID=2599291 RepID=UPI00131C83AC|nr:dienelactone hydrolase family protein [Chachezhania sediminis]
MIRTEEIVYDCSGLSFTGTIVFDDAAGPRPGVLVAHAFGGKGPVEIAAAEKLAAMGYVGFAADVYGGGVRATDREQASAMMRPLNADRAELLRRLKASQAAMAAHPAVDADRLAAIGFCFGGKSVLDMARGNTGVQAVASFHGIFDQPQDPGTDDIAASVLVLHGWDDPLATPEQTVALGQELTARKADWQILAMGHTGHAFTNPAAADRDGGSFYEPRSTDRGWAAVTGLLAETFG